LLDQYGQPIIREVLTQQLAAASMMGVRQAVGSGVTRGLSPQRLAEILRDAEDGDPQAYFELAEEMEEKDLHYLAVLGTRKRQISQLDMTVEAPSGDDPDAEQITADVQRVFLDSGLLDNALFDILDAVGKGISLSEIIWRTDADKWTPIRLEYVDPRFIRFDLATRRAPMLIGDDGLAHPLPPWKFVSAQIKAKSGIPLRSGLARPVAWAWMFKNFTIKDWMQFLDVYGIPFRLGKYAPGAGDDDKRELLRSVASISSDAAAIIPNTMDIQFVETKAGSGSSDGGIFGGTAKFFDDQISKAVLGQTGTTDSTPGKLGGAQDHTQVREDIERADAKALMACINAQLIRPYVDLNYGPKDQSGKPRNYPWVWIGRPEQKDVALMIDTAVKLVPMGLRVRQDDIRVNVGLTEPQEGDEVLRAPAVGTLDPTANAIPSTDLRADLSSALGPLLQARALASSLAVELLSAGDAGDQISHAVRAQLSGWQAMMRPAVDQIINAAAAAKDEGEFRSALARLHGKVDMNALGNRLAILTFQAFAGGAVGDRIKPARPGQDG
jgi:phage gp29-like protein